MLEILDPRERLEEVLSTHAGRDRRSCRSRAGSARASRSRWSARRRSTTSTSRCSAIQKELGERDEFKNEIQELEEKIDALKLPEARRREGPQGAQEAQDDVADVGRGDRRPQLHRLDPLAALGELQSEDEIDVAKAEQILEDDHYGLEKPKERILEYLAVQRAGRADEGPDPVPGRAAGRRQDLARPVDRARHRPRLRAHVSLGGVRDEAEIRGHRRTYIGAMPGKIIQSLKKAGLEQPGLPARRDRQDVDGLPRRSRVGLLEVLDPGAEQHLRRSLPRSRLRPLEDPVHHHREHARRHPAAAAGPHGDHPDPRATPRRRSSRSPGAS